MYSFAKKYARFSFDAIQALKKHTWPGNIRELKNVVARCAATYPGQQIEPHNLEGLVDTFPGQSERLPTDFAIAVQNLSDRMPLIKEVERSMIMQRLAANRGNQRKTAHDLGMPKSTLHDRLKIYQIDPKSYAGARA